MLLVATNTYAQPLEQFLSHPIESNFASSPDGKSIAWVINDHGKRNILVKTGTDLPRFLTDYPLDDGQEISQLVFSPNGTKLLYVRGGGANRSGQNPNPASLVEGTDQAIYYKEISSKSPPAKIVNGNSPVFFKDGIKFCSVKVVRFMNRLWTSMPHPSCCSAHEAAMVVQNFHPMAMKYFLPAIAEIIVSLVFTA